MYVDGTPEDYTYIRTLHFAYSLYMIICVLTVANNDNNDKTWDQKDNNNNYPW